VALRISASGGAAFAGLPPQADWQARLVLTFMFPEK